MNFNHPVVILMLVCSILLTFFFFVFRDRLLERQMALEIERHQASATALVGGTPDDFALPQDPLMLDEEPLLSVDEILLPEDEPETETPIASETKSRGSVSPALSSDTSQ